VVIFKRYKFQKFEVDPPQFLPWTIALFSGILMALTTAPVNAWPLAWFALVPLWILVVSYAKPQQEVRQGLKPLPQSESPLKRTEELISPLQRTLAISQGLKSLAAFGRMKQPSWGEEGVAFLLLPLFWGIGYHGLALSWIMGIHPMTWLGVPWWPSLAFALFCWVFITLWGAALVTVWAWLFVTLNSLSLVSKNSLLYSPPLQGRAGGGNSKFSALIRVLIGTALWCALESLWSSTPLWWTSLSYTQSPHNLAILHLGQLSGPSAVTAAIIAVNGLIAEAYIEGRRKKEEGRRKKEEGRRKKEEGMREEKEGREKDEKVIGKNWIGYIWPVSLCLILHIAGWSLYNRPLIQSEKTALKIGIVQGNIPNEIKFDSGGWRRALEGYTAGYKQLADRGVDAVLTPETALPFVWTNEYQRSTLSFYQAILDRGVLAWIGGFGQQDSSMTNSLFTIDKTGEIISHYDKTKLVPLGEYIPFYEILGGIINRLSPLDAHLVPGNPRQLFDTPFGRAIVGICYDSAFAEIFRSQAANGGKFILTASNNAHYKPPMLAQHHALDVMRAIETDRWAAIATNTGYSAFVNPHGETVWMSGINTYEVQDTTIYRRQTQTLYVRWGDRLTPLLLVLAGFAIIWHRIA
jgi:apolipoprotein N-acyltransferase